MRKRDLFIVLLANSILVLSQPILELDKTLTRY